MGSIFATLFIWEEGRRLLLEGRDSWFLLLLSVVTSFSFVSLLSLLVAMSRVLGLGGSRVHRGLVV